MRVALNADIHSNIYALEKATEGNGLPMSLQNHQGRQGLIPLCKYRIKAKGGY